MSFWKNIWDITPGICVAALIIYLAKAGWQEMKGVLKLKKDLMLFEHIKSIEKSGTWQEIDDGKYKCVISMDIVFNIEIKKENAYFSGTHKEDDKITPCILDSFPVSIIDCDTHRGFRRGLYIPHNLPQSTYSFEVQEQGDSCVVEKGKRVAVRISKCAKAALFFIKLRHYCTFPHIKGIINQLEQPVILEKRG